MKKQILLLLVGAALAIFSCQKEEEIDVEQLKNDIRDEVGAETYNFSASYTSTDTKVYTSTPSSWVGGNEGNIIVLFIKDGDDYIGLPHTETYEGSSLTMNYGYNQYSYVIQTWFESSTGDDIILPEEETFEFRAVWIKATSTSSSKHGKPVEEISYKELASIYDLK